MKHFLLFLIIISSNRLIAQSFEHLYGNASNQEFSSIVQLTNGGGYIVSGTSYIGGVADIYIARIDLQGRLVWQFLYGGFYEDIAYSSVLKSNGNVVVAAASSSFNSNGDLDVLLIEVNISGHIQWTRNYRRPGSDEIPRKINQSPQGLVLCSTIGDPGSISPDFYLFEVTSNGSRVIWENRVGIQGNFGDLCSSIIPSQSGGFIMVGGSYTPNSLYDQVIIRLDRIGNVISHMAFGGLGNENAEDIIELPNNDLIVMGNFRLLSGSGLEYSLSRISPNGVFKWIRTYGDQGDSDERAYGFGMLNDGGYVISGYTNFFGRGGSDVLLITTDENGILLRSSAFGSLNNENSSCLKVDSDNSVILSGISNSFNSNGLNDALLIKTNSNQEIANGCFSSNVLQNNLLLPVKQFVYNEYREGLAVETVNALRVGISFSRKMLSCPTLPVDLISFDVINNNELVEITWKTSKEYNSDYFLIERSTDGINWITISTLKSKGNSTTINEYYYLDKVIDVYEKYFYYRLKQVDYNGDYVYSNSSRICITCDYEKNANDIIIYPLPVKDNLNIGFFSKTEFEHDINIVDLRGNILYSKKQRFSKGSRLDLNLDLSYFPKGVYLLSINDGHTIYVKKIIKNES